LSIRLAPVWQFIVPTLTVQPSGRVGDVLWVFSYHMIGEPPCEFHEVF
jgi:hypothetical protein